VRKLGGHATVAGTGDGGGRADRLPDWYHPAFPGIRVWR
jgi:hypothetical protein